MPHPQRSRTKALLVRRDFASGRMESQILAQTYELIVPVIRAGTSAYNNMESAPPETLARRHVQGA